jgi:hypothetical protein
VEGENIMQVLCRGCDRNLKSGTKCETCDRWYHNSCGNVNAQLAESGQWNCVRCRPGRLRLLEEKLEKALLKIDELKRKRGHLKNSYYLQQLERNLASGIRRRYSMKAKNV